MASATGTGQATRRLRSAAGIGQKHLGGAQVSASCGHAADRVLGARSGPLASWELGDNEAQGEAAAVVVVGAQVDPSMEP